MDDAEVVASAAPVMAEVPPAPEVAEPEQVHVPAPQPVSADPVPEPVAASGELSPDAVEDPLPSTAPQLEPVVQTEIAATAAIAEPPPPPLKSNSLDDSLLAVLREEAEREVAQRRAEASRGIETQTDLGIDNVPPVAPVTKPPVAPPRGPAQKQDFSYLSSDADLVVADHEAAVPEASVRPAARRDLLPDVEVISSTLRSSRGGADDDNPMPDLPPVRRSGGFRSGFLLSVLLALIVVVVYVTAPRLAEQFPAAKSALDSYVTSIDGLRLWIGTLVANLNGMLEPQS